MVYEGPLTHQIGQQYYLQALAWALFHGKPKCVNGKGMECALYYCEKGQAANDLIKPLMHNMLRAIGNKEQMDPEKKGLTQKIYCHNLMAFAPWLPILRGICGPCYETAQECSRQFHSLMPKLTPMFYHYGCFST